MHPVVKASLFVFAVFSGNLLFARDNSIRIDVVVDVTEAGSGIARPTPDHPVYYFPYTRGYTTGGTVLSGERPPPLSSVQRLLATALAGQGYRVTNRGCPPSLLLVFWWGYNADDHKGMEELVLGSKYDSNSVLNQPSVRLQTALAALDSPRYYVMVSALDFKDFVQKRFTVLWTARVSTELKGRHLEEVLPALVSAGAPLFGKETHGPDFTVGTMLRTGRDVADDVALENYIPVTRAARPVQELPQYIEVVRNAPIQQP